MLFFSSLQSIIATLFVKPCVLFAMLKEYVKIVFLLNLRFINFEAQGVGHHHTRSLIHEVYDRDLTCLQYIAARSEVYFTCRGK